MDGSTLQRRLQEYAMSRGERGFTAEILAGDARTLRLAAGARAASRRPAKRARRT